MHIQGKSVNIAIIQTHAPTPTIKGEEIGDFDKLLESEINWLYNQGALITGN